MPGHVRRPLADHGLQRIRNTTAARQRRKRALANEARALLASRSDEGSERLALIPPDELDAEGFEGSGPTSTDHPTSRTPE